MKLTEKIPQLVKIINQPETWKYIALFPLIWNWLPIMTFYRDRNDIVKTSLYSATNSFLFLLISIFNLIIAQISWHGEIFSFYSQIVNIILYVSISGFLIYLQSKNGSIEFKPYEKIVEMQFSRQNGRP